MASILLCVYAGLSPRKAVKSLAVINYMFHGLLGDVPCHTTIRSWLKKMGLDIIKNKGKNIDEAYAIIMDASISVNDQQLLLALKVPADHTGKALTHNDEEVVGLAVSNSWTADKVKEFCDEVTTELSHAPEYYITDNGSNLKKAIEALGAPHHRDISHTLAMFLKHTYEKDAEFIEFKQLVGKTKHLASSSVAYLMPPKQRAIARFMNLYPIIDWAKKIQQNYHKFPEQERYHYSFIIRHSSLVDELDEVLTTYTDIMKICKQEGLSIDTSNRCKQLINQRFLMGSERQRMLKACVLEYLDKEAKLLSKEHPVHNITSDLIESEFGIFKESLPSNKINGFTISVLYIPIRAKLGTLANADNIDVKKIMERTTVNEVKLWKKENLRQNPMVKRRNLLVA